MTEAVTTESPALGYWHPVLLSRELRAKPQKVRLLGQEIAVFRDGRGGLGAVDNGCIHRGAKLHLGQVVDGELRCGYHAWCYRADGCVRAPPLPDAKLTTGSFDVLERAGAVWVRRAGSDAPFPDLFDGDVELLTTVRRHIKAPMELLLDNFAEVEHWHTVHQYLGYALEDIGKITFAVDSSDRSVHVVVRGPQKPLPRPLQAIIGVHSNDPFVEEWTTYFEPVYTVYRHWWHDPHTMEERGETMHFANFFNAVDDGSTDLFVFAFMASKRWRGLVSRFLYRNLMEAIIKNEVRLDRHIVESLAERGPSLAGLRLDPLDRAIVLNRKRIDAVYRKGPKRDRSQPLPPDAPADELAS